MTEPYELYLLTWEQSHRSARPISLANSILELTKLSIKLAEAYNNEALA